MKKLSKKGIAGIVIGIIVVIAIIVIAIIMTMRIDSAEARSIALSQAGGGEVQSEEVSSEGLWNEYSYVIINGDKWYEIETGGFGGIGEVKSGTGQVPID